MKLLRISLGLGMGFAGVVGMAITAVLACTSLATLNVSQPTGATGTDVNVTGSSFQTTDKGASAVSLRWNAIDGPVLAQVAPDASGSITATITVPANLQPGDYIIVATQTDKTGQPAFGTPARLAFEVTGSGTAAPAVQTANQAAAPVATSNGLGVGAGTLAILAGLGVLGILLFIVGAATFVGTYRRSPVASPVRKS